MQENAPHILIADCTSHPYNGKTVETSPVGGIPIVTVRLAEALSAAGCSVVVRNHTPEHRVVNGVEWQPLTELYSGKHPDFIIANNDVSLFDGYATHIRAGTIPLLWVHNLLSWKRLFKKKRVGAMLRWRPHAVFLGTYHSGTCPRLMPLRSRQIISHGVGDDFFTHERQPIASSQVLFLAKAFRGFPNVVRLWQDKIYPSCPHAALKAYIGRDEVEKFGYTQEKLAAKNIIVLDRAPQATLMEEMSRSACLLYPGHKDETFCNIAAEASVMGLPIATRGIGSLAERAAGGRGICADGDDALALEVIRILSEPEYQLALSRQALAQRETYRWSVRAGDWLALFAQLRGDSQQS